MQLSPNVLINYIKNSQTAEKIISATGPGIWRSSRRLISSWCQALAADHLEEFEKRDILVLNAGIMGIMGSKILSDVDERFFHPHIRINVKGPLFLTQAVAPVLKSVRLFTINCTYLLVGGRIIIFSLSLTQKSSVLPDALVYLVSKSVVE